MNNWLIEELIAEQRMREAGDARLDVIDEARHLAQQPRLRRAVASGLVRLGMSLDRSAGERVLAPWRHADRWEEGHGVYS